MTLADVTNNQQDGSALLLLLVDLVKFSSGAIQHLTRIRQESRRYTDSYLNTHLVRPNRFKTYQELNSNGTFTDPYQQNNDPYADPYQQDPNNPNTNPYVDPYQQNNTNPYNDPYNQNQNQNNTNPYTDPYQQNQNTDPYNQNQNQNNTNPYADPYQQNQNPNANPYGYDGQARTDSLGNPIKVDSTKLQKDVIYFQPKKGAKDTTKTKQSKQVEEKKGNKKKNNG